MSRSRSALPPLYYTIFCIYEPILTTTGFIGTLLNPTKAQHLPLATRVTIVQLAHVCGLLGLVNIFLLRAAHQYLSTQLALQEKIVGALLTPLLIGDILHLVLTLWALGDVRWNVSEWGGMLWVTVLLGFTLLIPRVTWHLGIGRYMEARDSKGNRK
ncbi:hypothetical protein B0F90DRAFT_1807918 [Multifurca ochricompacta]|uniref:DUF7704 domain-containing protein n=1 Tax=Multifurca ochricompacta TaxID=376703 RepID=A0AAD4MBE1_9AGAM|nr:hypothetical protein B0F90DRAFT_1807918 [Multifurca ochricompacta]